MRFSAADVAAAVGGRLDGPDVAVDGASIDTREGVAGTLFVPIVGARDGHDFVDDALAAGACAYLTARGHVGGTAVVVDDTARALSDLGRAARSRIPGTVVGITGSVGKTTVKDLLAATLAVRLRSSASVRSFNNELGVPLTLVNAPDGAEAVVVEMGARGIGHITQVCDIARPTVGVVTVVGHVHTELFGTIDDVARGKSELVAALPPEGTAVLNAEDERVRAMAAVAAAKVIRYGGDGDVVADGVRLDDELRASFRLRTPWGDEDVHLGVRGEHQVGNALAAAAAALACGLSVGDVAAGLGTASLSPHRMDLVRTPAGALVLNDAYNANPVSMRAALRSLARLDAARRVAVLGTMAELGDVADDAHAEIGRLAKDLGVEVVAVAEPRYGVRVVDDIDAAVDAISPLRSGDAVLLKASRVAGLERMVDLLVEP